MKPEELNGNIKKITKELLEGEECTLICHICKSEAKLGRSLVLDLNAPRNNNFRQVDHRTIEFIILKNVKYVLSKGSKAAA